MAHEFGLFVRSMDQLNRAQAAAKKAGVPFKVLDENVETTSGHVSIGTMHLAKGLEFRAVAVMNSGRIKRARYHNAPWRSLVRLVGAECPSEGVETERAECKFACLLHLALVAPEAREAGAGTQLKGRGALLVASCDGPYKAGFDVGGRCALHPPQLAFDAVEFTFPHVFVVPRG
jgi:hypothetical protein